MKNFRKITKTDHICITGGQFRGAKLLVPTKGTHPMGARERLALFNMIDCSGQDVLDLFAGSGALGFEALSRGAASVCFVDNSPAACTCIRKNAETLGVEDKTKLYFGTMASLRDKNRTGDAKTSIVFVDPPYDHPEFFTTSAIQQYANFVKSGGTLVLSRPKNHKITPPDSLKLQKTRTYAALALDFFDKV